MHRGSIGCVSLLVVLTGLTAAAEDPTPPVAPSPALADDPRQVIERVLNIIEVVLEHHIEPPARQEMVLQGARALYDAARIAPPGNLAQRASALTDRDSCARLLLEAWHQTAAAGVKAPTIAESLRRGAFQPVPGNVSLLPAKELRVQEQLQANRYIGIGIALGRDEDSSLPKINILPNGPAEKAGAGNGDLIEKIDGESTKGLSIEQVVDRIRGPEGSQVTLIVRQESERESRTLTITRGLVPRSTVFGLHDGKTRYTLVSPGINYIRISEIGGSVVHELRQVEQELTAAGPPKALIVDLRDVEGGTPQRAALIADAFLSTGVIGRVRTTERVQEFTADSDCLFRDWPIAVLVNQETEGAAEWLAASLQDNRRATIVGIPTAGNALVMTGITLADESESVMLPTGLFERPSGAILRRPIRVAADESSKVSRVALNAAAEHPKAQEKQLWGVNPDHVLSRPMSNPTLADVEVPEITTVRGTPNIAVSVQPGAADPYVARACDVLAKQLKAVERRSKKE